MRVFKILHRQLPKNNLSICLQADMKMISAMMDIMKEQIKMQKKRKRRRKTRTRTRRIVMINQRMQNHSRLIILRLLLPKMEVTRVQLNKTRVYLIKPHLLLVIPKTVQVHFPIVLLRRTVPEGKEILLH
jgi:hypothetical protein